MAHDPQDGDLLSLQERIDASGPRAYPPIGPRVEVARGAGADWSLTAWKASDGFCLGLARASGGTSRSHGQLPREGGVSQSVVLLFATTVAGASFIAGLVLPTVRRVEVDLRDCTTKVAETDPAPVAHKADLRVFLILAPFDEQPLGPGYSPLVLEYRLIGGDGSVLERLPGARVCRRD